MCPSTTDAVAGSPLAMSTRHCTQAIDIVPSFLLIAHQCRQIRGGDTFLFVCQHQEPLVRCLHLLIVKPDAEIVQTVPESSAARMLAEHQLGALPTNVLRVHDLVGRAVFQHAILVDTGFMREGVFAHDRFIDLHIQTGQPADDG